MRVRERPELGSAVAGATLLALLPWLGPKYLLPAAPVAVALVRWTARRGRRTAALAAAEIMVASLVVYVTLNDRLYGGFTPSAVAASGAPATGASSAGDYLERIPRLAALWIDRDVGLLRWAPVLALSVLRGVAAVALAPRSRRAGGAERADAEVAAGLALLVCAGVVAVAAFAAPSLAGEWFPARHLAAGLPMAAALAAWGLRHAPRTGAVLGALTLLGSLWLVLALAFGSADGWVAPRRRRPLRAGGRAAAARGHRLAVVRGRRGRPRARPSPRLVAREWWRSGNASQGSAP